MRLFLASILFLSPAYADSGWQLNLLVFSSSQGHGLSVDTFVAEFRLPAQSEEDCNAQGNNALRYFKSGQLPDNAVSLAGFSCELVP